MRSNTGNSSSGSEIGEAVVVELGLNLQNQDPSFLCNQKRKSSSAVDHDDGDGTSVKSPVNSYAPSGFVKGLQTFDSSYPQLHPLFNHSGGGGMGFQFTRGQWKELERQAMIYKYMVASLPVPSQLLYSSFPTTLSPPSHLLGKYGSGLNLRWVGNSKDAEPGRCRRTDGKKWRCSRDAAPNQKYCERHMHRGRPRSRKPVELHHHSPSNPTTTNNKIKNPNPNTKKTRLNDPNILPVIMSSLPSVSLSKASTFDHPIGSSATPFETSRSLAWAEEQQQWHQLVHTNLNPSVSQQQFDGVPLNLNSDYVYNPKSEMGLLERPLMGLAEHKDSYGNDHCNPVNENMCQMHMSLGVIDSPGGPLAEVLRRPDVSEVEFLKAVSSPSGVLQKPYCSFSDSSGSSTPTYKAKSDMTFNWMS